MLNNWSGRGWCSATRADSSGRPVRLGELVTELYLADTDAKKKKLWERVEKAMMKLEVPATILEHILAKRDVQILAKNVQEWFVKSSRKK